MMGLVGQNIAVFDLEIKEEIDGKKITWNDHKLMGISVGVSFHYKTMEFHVFMDDNLEELPKLLNSCDLVSGFNITGFDNPLLNASAQTKLRPDLPIYDLLVESRLAAGWKKGDMFPKGMKLDDHLECTFGKKFMKTDHGANAPLLWKAGKLGQLTSYCIADVMREVKLFGHVWHGRPVKTPNHPERILRAPNLAMRKPADYKPEEVGHS